MSNASFTERFSAYFDREVAQKAAKSLVNGSEIEFTVLDGQNKAVEAFTFTRQEKRNKVLPGPARDPQLAFELTVAAAEHILSDGGEDIGSIGVNIAKLIVSKEADKKVWIHFKTGFLGLFSKGYFGVITAGGGAFGSFLAQHGLNGIGAIKEALKKLKS